MQPADPAAGQDSTGLDRSEHRAQLSGFALAKWGVSRMHLAAASERLVRTAAAQSDGSAWDCSSEQDDTGIQL